MSRLGKYLPKRLGDRLGKNLTAAGASVDANLTILLNATGKVAAFNADYGYTKDVSNKLSGLVSQDLVGGVITPGAYTLAQATGAQQPTYGAASPLGRIGHTYASGNRLVDTGTTLAAFLGGSNAYSYLLVARSGQAVAQIAFCAGHTATANEYAAYGYTAANLVQGRRATAGVSITKNGTAGPGTTISTLTTVNQAARLDAWADGATTIVNDTTLAAKAPTVNTFGIGGLVSGGTWSSPFVGDFYFLLISSAIWTVGERQSYEAAARAYWIA